MSKVVPTPLDPKKEEEDALMKKTPSDDTRKELSDRGRKRLVLYPEDPEDEEVHLEDLSARQRIEYFMDHVYFTIALTFLTLFSLTLLFINMFEVVITGIAVIDTVLGVIFATETFTRCIVIGPKRYFSDILCICDCLVSVIDITIFIIEVTSEQANSTFQLIRILRVARLSKISRIARLTVKVDSSVGNDERGKPIETDEDGHIFAFNSANLFSLGYFVNHAGTVVAMPEIWVQCLIFVIITTALATVTCPVACDPTLNTFDPEEDCTTCVNSFDPSYGLMFLGLAAFLLGIFAQLLFDRWWDMRVLIQSLFSEIKDAAILTTSFVRGEDEFSIRVRKDVIRWAKLSAYLVEKRIDGKVNYRDAVQKGWLTEAEWDRLEGIEVNHLLPQQWAFDLLCRAKLNALAEGTHDTFDILLECFLRQRAHVDDLLMIMNTPLPYDFLHLMTWICKVNLLFMSVSCGTVVGQAVKQKQYLMIAIGYIIVVLGNMLIEGLLRLHVVLSDPFGDDPCDFPWQMLLDEMDSEVMLIQTQHAYFVSQDQKLIKNEIQDRVSTSK
jgi:hypothetical protein